MALTAVHHYTFDAVTSSFKSITTPSPEQRNIFGGILNDVLRSAISRKKSPIIVVVLLMWLVAVALMALKFLPIMGCVGIVIVSGIGGWICFRLRRRKGSKLVDDVMDHMRKRKIYYDNLLKEIAYTVNYSFHFNGKSLAGYIEFIPIEDIIQMNQATDRSRMDTFENDNQHTFEFDRMPKML